MGISPILLGAAIASASIPVTTPQAPPTDPVKPALWMVTDGDTTIYLFGTFHALDGSAHWFKDGVKTAFQASDQLVLETVLPKPGTLSIPRTAVAVRPAVAKAGPAGSFAASTQMVMNATRRRGMSSAHGADAALRLAAEGSGKPIAGLESFEFQISMFSSLRPPTKAQEPTAAQAQDPATMTALSAALAQLQDAWVRGDMGTFVPMLEQMRLQSPEAYRTMFAERNARWASWIAGRLDQPGTVFVAVGAGHLAGRDSVQAQLAAIGVGSFRIN